MQQMIFGRNGQRKYMTTAERNTFLHAASGFDDVTLTLCWLISATGCRISEALAVSQHNIDWETKMVVFESLKKRRAGIYRTVPVPEALLDLLADVHGLTRQGQSEAEAIRLWPFSRATAYRRIRKVIEAAGLQGQHAMPKGLRHCFGVAAIQSQVPLDMVQRWLGHADMRTTAVYTSAMGPEERSIAQRMWRITALKVKPRSPVRTLRRDDIP
jgi:integrase/recombinase XerD